MQIAAREMMTMPSTGKLALLEWVQSDGLARVVTGFVRPSYSCRMTVVAAMTALSDEDRYFLCSGSPRSADSAAAGEGVGWCWFGKNSNRQHCLFFGQRRYWCTAGAGTWFGSAMHTIVTYWTGIGVPSYSLDGRNVTMQSDGATGNNSRDVGTAPMQVFGGGPQGIAYNVRIQRVALQRSHGQLEPYLCDFRAARNGRVAGLYDLVSGSFAPAVDGDLLCGGVIDNPEEEL